MEAAAGARRLAAIAELVARRVEPDGDERWYWACDPWDSAAAEVAAALNIGHRAASGLMHQALALRDRLPAVAALYREGQLSSRLVSVLTWRTQLVEDAEALALIDAGLAQAGTRWGPLSAYKLEQAIDALVERHDPGARRRTRIAARGRHVTIGDREDVNGTTSLWGRLLATDAALLERGLTQMIQGVCDQDARTTAQRRADALGALAAGAAQLTCTCGSPHCPTRGEGDPRAEAVVIHVLADSDTLTARPDPQMSGENEPAREQRPAKPAPPAPRGAARGDARWHGPTRPVAGRVGCPRRESAAGERARHRGPVGVSALDRAEHVYPTARHDLSVARLRPTRPVHRYRPHHAVSGRADPSVEQQVLLQKTPSNEDILVRAGRLERPPTRRRHRHRDLPNRPHLHHPPRLSHLLPDLQHHHRRPAPTSRRPARRRPRTDDAPPKTHPRRKTKPTASNANAHSTTRMSPNATNHHRSRLTPMNDPDDRVALRAGIPPFYVMDVWLAAAERQRSHGDLVNLSAGQPSAGAPEPVRAAAAAALERQPLGYSVALGISGTAHGHRRLLLGPIPHRRRSERRRHHDRLVGRIPSGVPGMLRRRRSCGCLQSGLSLLPQHPHGAWL